MRHAVEAEYVQFKTALRTRQPTFASSNVSRSVFSDSPDIPDTIDGAETLMKGSPSSYVDCQPPFPPSSDREWISLPQL